MTVTMGARGTRSFFVVFFLVDSLGNFGTG